MIIDLILTYLLIFYLSGVIVSMPLSLIVTEIVIPSKSHTFAIKFGVNLFSWWTVIVSIIVIWSHIEYLLEKRKSGSVTEIDTKEI